jgi:RND family efflux transporter MFP subunit
MKRTVVALLLLAVGGALAWAVVKRLEELRQGEAAAAAERPPVPIEVGPVERGPVTLRRTFTGTLEASAEFVVSPRVGGQIEALEADIGDVVQRGDVVARLDDDEFVQAANQAEADLAVARATRAESRSALEIATRELRRLEQLRGDGASSESQVDAARTRELAAQARVQVAEANVERAESSVEAARIRTAYTRVTADWTGDDERRTVAERYVDEGGTIAANGALMSIVELDPIVGVLFVPERDYARIATGQVAALTTDAYPGRSFEARVARIAPVFRRATRQARVELAIPNPAEELKPGMFVRATLELERLADVVVVPFDALTERGDETGVFALAEDGAHVAWVPVTVGVRDGTRVQVTGEGLTARVVTLGQALCDDGARVAVVGAPEREPAPEDERDVPGGGTGSPGAAAQEAR